MIFDHSRLPGTSTHSQGQDLPLPRYGCRHLHCEEMSHSGHHCALLASWLCLSRVLYFGQILYLLGLPADCCFILRSSYFRLSFDCYLRTFEYSLWPFSWNPFRLSSADGLPPGWEDLWGLDKAEAMAGKLQRYWRGQTWGTMSGLLRQGKQSQTSHQYWDGRSYCQIRSTAIWMDTALAAILWPPTYPIIERWKAHINTRYSEFTFIT